jgi:hypothetical protein
MPVTSARQMNQETSNRHQAGAPQMPKWNWVAMGQVGLTGWTGAAAKPVARAVARRTGRPEAQILSLIGTGFLAISLIDFLRQVDAVIAAGRPAPSASQGRSRRPRLGRPVGRRDPSAGRAAAGSEGQLPG